MTIHLTKKLADRLNLYLDEELEEDEFFSWRAHYVHGFGNRFIVVMNDASRFVVVIKDAKLERLRNLPNIFIDVLCATLLSFSVTPEVIDCYLNDLGEIHYSKNSDRKKTAQLNKHVDDIMYSIHHHPEEDDVETSLHANTLIYNTSGMDDVIIPREKMIELLGRYGLPVIMDPATHPLFNINKIYEFENETYDGSNDNNKEISVNNYSKANRILEYMKRYPDKWGTVIMGTAQGICDDCDNPAKVIFDDYQANTLGYLCEDCYNRLMAEYTGAVTLDIVPKYLSVRGKNGKNHDFKIDYFIFINGKMLTATEIGKKKRRAAVRGELDEDLNIMIEVLKQKMKKAVSVRYMNKDRYIDGDKLIGYIDYNALNDNLEIVIDGESYTWSDLWRSVKMHEGWNIKIEIACEGDEFE